MNAPLSPLEQAGLTLDLANARFAAAAEHGVGEQLLGEFEAEFLDARTTYARLVTERLGVDVETVLERLR